jgi:hypothetical protein
MLSPRLHAILAVLFLSIASLAQVPKASSAAATVDDAFVQKAFGSTCTLMPGPHPLTADLDGDGIQDIVIVARCTNPLLDQDQDNFQLIDPYNAFFGYGNPRITSQFASEDPERRGLVLLIIHGDGPQAWRSPTPKAKFVIINLPFKQVMVRKKYRYEPLGSGFE